MQLLDFAVRVVEVPMIRGEEGFRSLVSNSSRPSRRPAGPRQPNLNPLLADTGFSAVFETSAEALVVVDSVGTLQRANTRACDLLRLNPSLVRQSSLANFVKGPVGNQLTELAAKAVAETKPQSVNATLPAGFPIHITLRSILPGTHHLLLSLEDGSVVERANEKWRQVEAELRSVLDSVPAGVLLIDPLGRVRFSSARFVQLFSLDVRSKEHMTTFEGIAELLADRFRNPEGFSSPWRAFSDGLADPGNDELEMMRPARRLLERFYRPVLDAEGRAIGWLELYSDVTGERQIQSKMLQTEKMAALGQLVSGIAHELNNPLTAIMGYTQLLLGHGLTPPQHSEADKVYREAERARRIVKNLLYFARENHPERTSVDLNEVIERTLALRSYELKLENIVVECELAPNLPKTMADPYQLQQVVLNLVVNAEQALLEGRGQGHVWIHTAHVPTEATTSGLSRIQLRVSDDGPGVSPDIASRVFDPFFTTKRAGVGTGLGLSIVYGIVHQHGGEITLESQPSGGARFIVELPVVSAAETDPMPHVPAAAERPGGRLLGRILVVEDEPTVAHLMKDVLREEGHQVEAVLDSQLGLTALSREDYDLVICDLRMPHLDGSAFFEALVRSGSPMQRRIIFVTGDTLAPRTMEFLERHSLPFLAKPFLVEELKLAVTQRLEQNQQLIGVAGTASAKGKASGNK
jgi:signal transduction histidine kinase/CheY-like chemotaxis protein